MLDDFREWLSDNLRYILLGLAVILILVVIFFAVRLVSGSGSSKKTQQSGTERSTELQTEAESKSSEDNDLVRNEQNVYAFATSYFTARMNKDYDAIAALYESFDDKTETNIKSQDEAIESFSNIMTYSKDGLTSGSYVVYVYYEVKFASISTAGPTLCEWYLITDSEGNLVIADDTSDEVQDYILECRTDDDVQALMADVDSKLAEAKESDEDLKAYVESSSDNGQSDSGDSGDSDDSGSGSDAIIGTMKAATDVNVRGSASTDGTLYGTMYEGTECEVLENLDNGWSRVQYTSNGVTIEGYAKTEYLTTVD